MTNIKEQRGQDIGLSTLSGLGEVEVYLYKGHFAISQNNNFFKFAKASALRKAGIRCPVRHHLIYDQQGYVSPVRKRA